ncbi:MAG: hypothetical protein MJ000_07925 [Bacteroidales bacterium]|nr:hypothetical protein [Bacteroidales bacterium]
MKKLLLSAAVMLLSVASAFAQGIDTTLVVKNHEIKIYDNDDRIDVKVYELKDGERILQDPVYESRYNFDGEEGDRTVTIKMPLKRGNGSMYRGGDDNVAKKSYRHHRRLAQPLPLLYFSYMNIGDGAFGEKSSAIPQRPVSFEWGMYCPVTIFTTGRTTVFGMATGLGFSNSYNHFDTRYVMKNDVNGDVNIFTLEDYTDGKFVDAKKSYLRYWSFRLPLTMQLQWKVGRRPLTLSAGAEVEWRIGMRSFSKYDGEKHLIDRKLSYKPFGCNALFQVGYAGVILFTRFGLTDMFGSDAFNANQFTAGIGFNF